MCNVICEGAVAALEDLLTKFPREVDAAPQLIGYYGETGKTAKMHHLTEYVLHFSIKSPTLVRLVARAIRPHDEKKADDILAQIPQTFSGPDSMEDVLKPSPIKNPILEE